MRARVKTKLIIVLVVIIGALVAITPSLTDSLPGWWKKILPSKAVQLGLDLKGGMELLLEVQVEEAVNNALNRYASDLKTVMREKNIRIRSAETTGFNRLILEVGRDKYRDEAAAILREEFPGIDVSEESETTLALSFPDEEIERLQENSVVQALETIRSRVDEFGVTEPTILRQGERRILIQLPGIDDPQRAIDLVKRTAVLRFMLVDEGASVDNVPTGDVVLYGKEYDPATKRVTRTPYVLRDRVMLTGDTIKDARVRYDSQFGRPYVSLEFDKIGARIFEQVTAENVNRRLAIVLDENVYSAPTIRERIAGGSAEITGDFTPDEAADLAIVLRAGSLPASVQVLQKWTVSPTLGTDSIRKGLMSIALGFVVVILFMIFYFRYSGIVANVALILNLLVIMAVLALFQATLTLPGIAGIVLTIGMAVDANVLIFERIKEEQRTGKTVRAAIEAGYSKAFLTIVDANITTLIAALVLFQFGTGQVKGFAVTLTIGVITSMFTAIFVTRTIFEAWLENRKIEKLSI
ncbi:MAG: protein translocase subunit SecD [Proteobacteria bacterium]|nr:protein translocase subunit SecD [Pseudomonadota bacterium]